MSYIAAGNQKDFSLYFCLRIGSIKEIKMKKDIQNISPLSNSLMAHLSLVSVPSVLL